MRKNKIFGRLLLIFSSFCVFAACSPPIGHIYDSSGLSNHDDFWTVPRRQVYNLGDDFVRTEDLWVFALSQGMIERVNTNDVTIRMVTNPNAAVPEDPITIYGNGNGNGNGNRYTLASHIGKGRKLIIVAYGGMTAEYSIEIMDPLGILDDEEGEGENGSGGVWILW